MTTLYAIADVREAINAALVEAEGELSPSLEGALDAVDLDFTEKAERVAVVLKERLAYAAMLKNEEDELQRRRKSLENDAQRLRDYLMEQMQRVGKEKIEGVKAKMALRWNPPSIQEVVPTSPNELIEIAAECPGTVTIIPSVYQWDKKALLAAAKLGALPERVAQRVQVVRTQRLEVK
jgi:hypothetical protein